MARMIVGWHRVSDHGRGWAPASFKAAGNRWAAAVVLALLVLLPAGVARAQVSTSGKITGTVLDPSGKAIPGAVVTAKAPAINVARTVTASASGVYVFPALPPGTYDVSAAAKGFSTAVYHSVLVQVAQTTNVNIKMAIGAANQTVTVSAAGQILQTTQTTLSTTISPELIENLPLNGRDIMEFAALVPGAQQPAGAGQRYTTLNGLPPAANHISVNGTSDQFLRYTNFSTSFMEVAPLREGAFEEATVKTGTLGALNGAGASQIQFETKRGTNQFHGRFFWQTENSALNANTWSNNAEGIPNPKYRQNYFGGNLGGPLLPKSWVGNHSVYFFVNLEYNKQPTSYTVTNPTLTSNAANGLYTYEATAMPSAAQLTAAPWITGCQPFASAYTCNVNLYTLAKDNGFPATADPIMAKNLSDIAAYNQDGALKPLGTNPAALYSVNQLYLQNLDWNNSYLYKTWYPTTRLDVDITPNIHWSDSWDYQWQNTPSSPNWPGSSYVGGYTGYRGNFYTWSNSVDWILSPTMVNTTNLGIMGALEEWDWHTSGSVYNSFPVDGVGAYLGMPFGIPSLIPYTSGTINRNNPVWNPSDTLRWTAGNHSFYFGFNWVHGTMYELEIGTPQVPSYTTGIISSDPASAMFNTTTLPDVSSANNDRDISSAESLYALLTGRVETVNGVNYVDLATHQYQPGGGMYAREAQNYGGAYFQDSWRLRPDFTLNYGLRWEMTGAIHNTNDSYFDPTYANLLGPSTALFQPGELNGVQNPHIAVNPDPYSGDFKEPSPNIGFAWNPDIQGGWLGTLFGGNKTVIRGSYGLSYYNPGWEAFESASIYTDPGPDQAYYYSSAAGGFAPGSESLSSPGLYSAAVATATPVKYTTSIPESEFTFVSPYFATVDPNIKAPYVENWTFGIQRQLPGNFVVEVDYVGNHSVHGWMNYNLNEINATSNGFLGAFKAAQANLAANKAGGCGTTFADNTGCAGVVATPLFDAAFNGNGITTGAADPGGYANNGSGSFIYDLQTGQVGAMANTLATNYSYLCNMVGGSGGKSFSPCAGSTGAGTYPINYFEANPYALGEAQILSDPASSTYNALEISVRHPVGHGLTLGANYAWSKGLTDNFQSFFTDTLQANFTSLRDMSLNKGLGDNDIPNILHFYATYALPLGRGRAFDVTNSILNQVFGGWNIGTIVTWQSGIPFLVQGGYQTFNQQDGGVVLNGVNTQQVQSNIGVYSDPSVSAYAPLFINPKFNATSAIQPNTTPGTIGQLLFLHGPSFFNTDISLNKVFPIHESLSLKVQASFLNAFNHPNWITGSFGAPGYLLNAASGLSVPAATYAGRPRVVQFRTELDF